MLKNKIQEAEDLDELEYIRRTNEKKYWWASIFITGLFYALNGKAGHDKNLGLLFLTLGMYHLYAIYTSHKDENEFNNQMEYFILERTIELKK